MLVKKFNLFMKQATVIKVPYTLNDLKKPQDIEELERICVENLGPNQSAQCISARFVDPQGKTLLAYFGNRIKKSKDTGVRIIFHEVVLKLTNIPVSAGKYH